MFIELTEFLRCPQDHEEAFCIVLPDEMVGRMIMHGTIGCPACRREYPIEGGVARFGSDGTSTAGPSPSGAALDPEVVTALLGLSTPGGYVVLLGSAAVTAPRLGGRLGGVHFVGINAPASVEPAPILTLLRHEARIPLRSSMARGVVVPSDCAQPGWLAEGARVLLKGQRLVAAGEGAIVPGLTPVASGHGLWVGQKG